MSSAFSEDQSSDLNSYKSYKGTNLSRFLGTITPSLLNEMKQYLSRNKFMYEINIHDPHKLSLYEDLYAIVALKDKETEIFTEKGRLKQTIKQIAEYTKRSGVTIDQRMRKKLHQMTPEQLAYYIQNNKDIEFRGNSKMINTEQWPDNLKRNHSPINLDSDNESEISSVANHNRNIPKPKPQRKKFKMAQEVVRIENQPDGEKFFRRPEPQSPKQLSPINQKKPNDGYDMNDRIQRELFASKVVKNCGKKYLENYLKEKQNVLLDTQILYNFKKLEYMLINQKVVENFVHELRKQEKINAENIRQRQIESQVKDRLIRNRRNTDYPQLPNRRSPVVSIEEQEQDRKSTVPKKRSANGPRQTFPQIIELELDHYNQAQQQQNISLEQKEENARQLIEILQKLVENLDIQSLSPQAQQMLKKAIYLVDQTKKILSNKPGLKNYAIAQKETKHKSNTKNGIKPQYIQEIKQPNILDLISSDEDQVQELSKQSNQEITMRYWFNNNRKIYADYQNNPYKNGYLMWSQEEDNILQNANANFDRYSADLEKLVKIKSAEMVKKRIYFLKIKMSSALRFYIENIFKR